MAVRFSEILAVKLKFSLSDTFDVALESVNVKLMLAFVTMPTIDVLEIV